MREYRMGTKCVQAGYTPGNGEPRQVPIIQSTTFKYSTSEDMGKPGSRRLFLQPPSESYQRYRRCKDCSYGRRFGCNADFFRTGSQFSCHVQHLRMRRSHRCFLLYLWRNLQPACRYHGKDGDHDHICFPGCFRRRVKCRI